MTWHCWADANHEKTSPSWVDWHYVALPKWKTAACLKIAHTGVADASFLKTLTTLPFSFHVGTLFLLHLHRTQATSALFQRFFFNWRSSLLSWAAIEPIIPRAIADKPCVVDLIFSDFLCGGLTIFDFFHNGSLSACLTFWWIPLGASSSACLSSASRSFRSVPSDVPKLAD